LDNGATCPILYSSLLSCLSVLFISVEKWKGSNSNHVILIFLFYMTWDHVGVVKGSACFSSIGEVSLFPCPRWHVHVHVHARGRRPNLSNIMIPYFYYYNPIGRSKCTAIQLVFF
jgi:hypothetical protein